MNRTELKRRLRAALFAGGAIDEGTAPAVVASVLASLIERILRDHRLVLPAAERQSVVAEVVDDVIGWGPLQSLMVDPEVTEVMVNGPAHVYAEQRGMKVRASVAFDDEQHLRMFVGKLIHPSGRRVDETSPYADFSLPDGSRVNVVLAPVGHGGPHLTIRKFLRTIGSLGELVRRETLDTRMAEFLAACVRGRVNILFSGATGSGKTTTLEVLSAHIPEGERIVVIEDTKELNLRQEHVVSLLCRPANIEGKGQITLRDLFVNTLRMRPSRIIIGEVRGGEALDYLQSLSSGHGGSLAVLHASSPEDAVLRLETLAFLSGLNVPAEVIRQQIARGLQLIVHQVQLADGSRRIERITEVVGVDAAGRVELHDLFRFEHPAEGEGASFEPTGRIPAFLPRLARAGAAVPAELFRPSGGKPRFHEITTQRRRLG